jgi:hypothetical protein
VNPSCSRRAITPLSLSMVALPAHALVLKPTAGA